MKQAVVLLSGGLDSAVTLYLAKSRGFNVHALSFDYGQRHDRELQAAKAIAEKAGVSTGTVDRVLHKRGNISPKASDVIYS